MRARSTMVRQAYGAFSPAHQPKNCCRAAERIPSWPKSAVIWGMSVKGIGVRLEAIILGLAISLGAAHPLVPTVDAATRGLTVQVRASESKDAPVVEEIELYSRSYALIIGIDEYSDGWPRLSNAVKDAEEVAKVLQAQGFDVTLKRNLTSSELESAFKEFFVFKGADREARLFVWFAGHGYTKNGEGYIVPKDAPKASSGAQFRFRALSLRRFGEYVRQAQSKHAFAVFDSCFSGTIFDTARSAPPPAITAATVQPVRQFLSSGDAGQEVSDNGRFRQLFIEAITGQRRADANGDGYLTASELGMFLTDSVTNYSNRRQTPRYGKLNDPSFDKGDFVFQLASTEPKRAIGNSSGGAVDKETVFWQSISDSERAGDYEAYLSQFPNGSFATLARSRLSALKKNNTLSPPRPSYKIDALDETLVALKTVNVRELPMVSSAKVGELAAGKDVSVTGRVRVGENDWYRISIAGREAYVLGSLLDHRTSERQNSKTPTASQSPLTISLNLNNPPDVKKIQIRLKDLGLYVGPINGESNKALNNALENFKKIVGLVGETNTWDEKLQYELFKVR